MFYPRLSIACCSRFVQIHLVKKYNCKKPEITSNCKTLPHQARKQSLPTTEQGLIRHKPWYLHTIAVFQNSFRLSRKFQTVKTNADCQESLIMSRQFLTVKTEEDSQDCCKLSRNLQSFTFYEFKD